MTHRLLLALLLLVATQAGAIQPCTTLFTARDTALAGGKCADKGIPSEFFRAGAGNGLDPSS